MASIRRTIRLTNFLPLPTTGRQRDWERLSAGQIRLPWRMGWRDHCRWLKYRSPGLGAVPSEAAQRSIRDSDSDRRSTRANPLEMQGTASLSKPGSFNENQWMANADYLRSDRNKIALRYFGASSNVEWTVLYNTYGNPLFQPERFDVALDRRHLHPEPHHGEPIRGRFPSVGLRPALRQCVYLLEPGYERSGTGRQVPQSLDR